MKKKFKLFYCLFTTVLVCFSFSVSASEEIKVTLDGKPIEFDVQPTIISGRTMVPMRAIFEAFGAYVQWDDASNTITANKEWFVVTARIGDKYITVDGARKEMDTAPVIVGGRTLVPARFISEAFECDVRWDENSRTVIITSPSDNGYGINELY